MANIKTVNAPEPKLPAKPKLEESLKNKDKLLLLRLQKKPASKLKLKESLQNKDWPPKEPL